MNITTRMLRFGAALAAVAIGCDAWAAGLGPLPVQEAFENATAGLMATNALADWTAEGGSDESVISNLANTASSRPLPAAANTKVLKLATEGATLSANLDTSDNKTSFATQNIYVDTLVKFVVSEDDPQFTTITDAKVAVFANVESNLVIRHGMFDGEDNIYATNTITDVEIEPESWYRLTVALKRTNLVEKSADYSMVQVFLNGVIVTNENTYAEDWFLAAVETGSQDDDKLNKVSFQGTGFIDELVVTRSEPEYVFIAFYTVYTVLGQYGKVNGQAANVSYQVSAGSAFTNIFAADDWYKIAALDVNGVAKEDAADTFVYTQALASVTADVSNNVSFAAASGAELGGQFAGLTEDQLAWIKNFGKSTSEEFDNDGYSVAFEKAMGLDPYVSETVTAKITQFTVGDEESEIVVKVETNGVAYAGTGLTVNLLVDTKASLTNAWVLGVFTNSVSAFNASGETNIVFATPAANFFRARLLEQ